MVYPWEIQNPWLLQLLRDHNKSKMLESLLLVAFPFSFILFVAVFAFLFLLFIAQILQWFGDSYLCLLRHLLSVLFPFFHLFILCLLWGLASRTLRASEFTSMGCLDDDFDFDFIEDSASPAPIASEPSTMYREIFLHSQSSYNMNETQALYLNSHIAMKTSVSSVKDWKCYREYDRRYEMNLLTSLL